MEGAPITIAPLRGLPRLATYAARLAAVARPPSPNSKSTFIRIQRSIEPDSVAGRCQWCYTVSSYPVSPDFATTAGHLHMDKVKEETPDERGDELRLAAIHGDVTWQSIPIISTVLISYIAGSF
ncbi:hypothetical protein Y032_0015g2667 [Ancylostoma ceylanicum]|uniref:Uncharacterized protein n=1 Tax=Ancylostoma ceylanicum TaxID=53326 RepID=A0A016V736_9BILA|nr:hypothetical protein Y032_0015g2667 [Ancylostoma ceylanicum]